MKERGNPEKKDETKNTKERMRNTGKPKKIPKGVMKPRSKARAPKNIARGIKGSTIRFTGSATRDNIPVSYNKRGRTKICVERVEESVSLIPNFSVTKERRRESSGPTPSNPRVAIKES